MIPFWMAVYRKVAIGCRELTTVCVLRNAKWSTSRENRANKIAVK
jgi:hypothetical protein